MLVSVFVRLKFFRKKKKKNRFEIVFITSITYTTLDIGYVTAITLLNKRYGNLHSLLASYRREIKSLAPVKPGNTMGFREFNSALKCDTFFKSTNRDFLETPETLCVLVSKLSGDLRDRWNKKVQSINRRYGSEPCLSDFSGFLNEETILLNDQCKKQFKSMLRIQRTSLIRIRK